MKNIIKELRKERRISQEELANAVRVTRQTIISLENGKKSLKCRKILCLRLLFQRVLTCNKVLL